MRSLRSLSRDGGLWILLDFGGFTLIGKSEVLLPPRHDERSVKLGLGWEGFYESRAREKQIKKYSRKKKYALIEKDNPYFRELYYDLF